MEQVLASVSGRPSAAGRPSANPTTIWINNPPTKPQAHPHIGQKGPKMA
jgi:hypothetical protein